MPLHFSHLTSTLYVVVNAFLCLIEFVLERNYVFLASVNFLPSHISELNVFNVTEAINVRRRQKSISQDRSASPSKNQISVSGYHSAIVLPFVFHLSFMTATAFFVMHVQVTVILLVVFEGLNLNIYFAFQSSKHTYHYIHLHSLSI